VETSRPEMRRGRQELKKPPVLEINAKEEVDRM
jgi:hypothetical protein